MTEPSTDLSDGQLDSLTGRLRVGPPAQAFREHLAAGDLAGTWSGVDPALRAAWARSWTHSGRRRLGRLCPHRLATRLASPSGPSHALWADFERDQVQALHEVGRAGQQSPSTTPPPLPPDVEVLYADPRHPSAWASPCFPGSVPMLMRWNGTTWLVLNYGSTTLPVS